MRYKIKFILKVEGDDVVEADSPEEAINKLLRKDAVDIVESMNIYESDCDEITYEEE